MSGNMTNAQGGLFKLLPFSHPPWYKNPAALIFTYKLLFATTLNNSQNWLQRPDNKRNVGQSEWLYSHYSQVWDC